LEVGDGLMKEDPNLSDEFESRRVSLSSRGPVPSDRDLESVEEILVPLLIPIGELDPQKGSVSIPDLLDQTKQARVRFEDLKSVVLG